MMLREAMEWISTREQGKLETIDERAYWTMPGKSPLPIIPPAPDSVTFSSLTGLAEYIEQDPDGIFDPLVVGPGASVTDSPFIHIADESGWIEVHCLSILKRPWLVRHHFARAIAKVPDCHPKLLGLSEMILTLRTHFASSRELNELLEVLCGIVVEDKTKQFTDDGLSQVVNVKSGVASIKHMPVPGFVQLIPLGGFAEVDMPKTDYILRLKKGHEEPQVTLAPVLSPDYALEYMSSVQRWLIENITREALKIML